MFDSLPEVILRLAWLIPVFPFLAFLIIALWARRDNQLCHILAITAVCFSLVLSQVVFWAAVLKPVGGGEHAWLDSADWIPTGSGSFQASVWIDPLTGVMLFMVPIVCLMIFIYSVGYMNYGTPEQDKRYARFFCYIALFATGMLGLVVSGNLLMLFIFWEVMGLCSYLLIGFWFEKESALKAGLKAFITTRVGDLFFLLGLVALYSAAGSLQFEDVLSPETLVHLSETTINVLGLHLPALPTIAILIFGGTVGKSAQVPLHVWLPDAMEGPTPVSALIHAATMVSAGVYLVARMWPLTLAAASLAPGIVLWIGAITALFGAIIGVFQDDIKRVLAFSTISQLGYMIAALGLGAAATDPALQIGAYVAGVFHLITHAFFKALLFLASGSVIHGMEHGHHHVHSPASPHGHEAHQRFDANDMKNMGGLWKRMPRTFWTFVAGALALSGFPLITAGFWSKDEILAMAYEIKPIIFGILVFAAGLTAFYTARQISMTFLGKPRTKAAEHAPESVHSMTVPLIVLAVFAVSLGWAGIPDELPVIGPLVPNWVHGFVETTIEEHVHLEHHAAAGQLASLAPTAGGSGDAYNWAPLAIGLAFALGGLAVGWFVYARWQPIESADQLDPLERALRKIHMGWLYEFFRRRAMFDELYQKTFIGASIAISRAFAWFDSTIVDGALNGAGWLGRTASDLLNRYVDEAVIDAFFNLVGKVAGIVASANRWFDTTVVNGAVDLTGNATTLAGKRLRRVQSGQVQAYLIVSLVAVVALVAVYLVGTQWLNW
jgi:NADH-quinone oxidoreductase subunit L